MTTQTTSHCKALGFDGARIQETLSILGLDAEYGVLAGRIRGEIIAGSADEFVNSCFSTLARSRSFCLIDQYIGAENFRQHWLRRLQCFGRDFDTAEYFEERLGMAAAFMRARIPFSILQLPFHLTQQALISHLSNKFTRSPENIWPLLTGIMKLTSLDLYLAAEGYRLPELEELQNDLSKLREEASRLRKRTATDELTGTMTYSKLMETLEQQISHARREGCERNPLCLIMADLDLFKKINDTYGHLVGDLVLRHVAERIRAAVRDLDVIGRFGGEEFVIVMANASRETASGIAERIREDISRAPFHVKGFDIPVTISLGVAMLRQEECRESLLERADAAMYEAKRTGRNRVVIAPG
ncbi:MAG TPA: GGDEF domain-containing protein [Nitrosospira sp.]